MKCWICGAEADSGEHLPKDSTLKDLFGNVTQQKPLYHSGARGRNKRLQSTNSKLVKLRVLCAQCNSSRTQRLDRAWDGFMEYLNNNEHSLNTGSVIRFNRACGYRAREKMLNLHLYAVKLFGCVAAEHSIPLDLSGMADAIKHRRPYRKVYLGLGKRTWLKSLAVAGPSDVEADLDGDKCVFAVWFLTIGKWEFQFIYAVSGQQREGLADTWNPALNRRVRLKKFVN
ncbi:hypothetical protein PQR14_09360 [Paraburkholderia bryophila]|uniref:hypothetical protein n=1 Tax=Paraburkholderia bryophila TaxID=420952 RepID=UPI0038BD7AB3